MEAWRLGEAQGRGLYLGSQGRFGLRLHRMGSEVPAEQRRLLRPLRRGRQGCRLGVIWGSCAESSFTL